MKLNFRLSPSAKRRQNPCSGFPPVYRLEGLSVRRAKQEANLMYKCINNLAPALSVCPKNTELLFSQREEKN